MYLSEFNHEEALTKKEVKKAYKSLIQLKQYDDALLIQLMYSFALDPDTLCMLKYGNVDSDGVLSYRNCKTNKNKRIKLDNKTIAFILFLIEFKGKDHPYFKVTERKSRSGYVDEGIFMINIKISHVYRKFRNNFNGLLDWPCVTPEKVIKINHDRVHKNKRLGIAVPI